jgi:hypothetical protein
MLLKRSWSTTGGAIVSAGILAVGLVIATPEPTHARIEVRPVHLTALALSPSAYLGALQRFIIKGVPAPAPVGPAAKPNGADVSSFSSVDATGPTTKTSNVAAAALAAPIAAASILDPILGIVSPILGLLTNPAALLLFAPIILLVVVACPPCALINFVTTIFQSFVIGLTPVAAVATAATLKTESTVEPMSTVEPPLDSGPSLKDAPAIDARGVEKKRADDGAQEEYRKTTSEPVTPAEGVTETATTEQESTPPKDADGSESTTPDPKPEPEESHKQQATPRPVVRHSLAGDERQSDPPHRDKDDHDNKTTADDATPKHGVSADAPSHPSSSES